MKHHPATMPGAAPGRIAPPRTQRGLALMGVVTLMLALLFAVLALDTGRLWVERRNLQKVADMASLESARYTGCGSSLDDAKKAVQHAVDNNRSMFGSVTQVASVTRGRVTTSTTGTTYLAKVEPTDDTDSTQVSVQRTVPTSLFFSALDWAANGNTASQTVTLTAQATARGGPPVTSFSLGSTLLSVDTTHANILNALFGAVLGGPVNISPDGYNALGSLNININGLMKILGVTTIDELLNKQMPLSTLISAIANATFLTSSPPPDGKTALDKLVAAVGSNSTNISLGQLLQIQSTVNNDALLNANINVLDLLTTSVRVAGQDALLSIKVGVPGISSVDLKMGQVSKLAIGPAGKSIVTGNYCTEARVDNTELGVNVAPSFLAALGVVIDIRVSLDIAPAIAHAEYIEVTPDKAVPHMGVNTGVGTVRITNTAGTGLAAIKLLGIPILEIGTKTTNSTLFTYTPVPINIATPVQDHLPALSMSSSESAGALQNILNIANLDIRPLGIKLDFMQAILKPISDLLSTILSTVLDPFIRILGVNFGSANIQVIDVRNSLPSLAL